MNHHELRDKVLKAMGGKVPISFQDRWGDFVGTGADEIFLPYSVITNPSFYTWAIECPDVDWHEGAEGIRVWICRFGRVGH